jgi:2-polyprenyl-3-methyl-5-hydroxy-6-metoxy-1,4-benzoquinol methylase
VAGRKNYAETEVACMQRARKDIASIEKLKSGGTLLDVGCGLGYVLDAAKQRGWNEYGIDLSSYAVGVCRNKDHGNVWCGTMETVALQRDYFDVVTAFDVFEHVCDPNKFLQDVHAVLKDNGLIVVAVPNVRSLAAILMGKRWSQFILPEHLNYFSTSTLDRILRNNHFKVIQIFSEPSITLGLRKEMRRLMRTWSSANWIDKAIDGITLFKRYVFYPPINWLVKKLGVEANLLVAYAIRENH